MFKLIKYIIIIESTKKGPNGIRLFLYFSIIIIDIGSAISEAKKIENTPICGPNTNPIVNISFISPPPNVSFLNILLPIYIIRYIIINNNIPLPNLWINSIGLSYIKYNVAK